jgi:hypothetical protein
MGEARVRLITVYLVTVFVGLLVSYGIGSFAEMWSDMASLFAFLGCFFATLGFGWRLAVVLT